MMRKFLPVPLISFSSALVVALGAGAANADGFYIGAGVGDVEFEDDGITNDLSFFNFRVDSKADDTAKIITAGYRFNKIVGVELSYTDYGAIDFTFNGRNLVDWDIQSVSVAANVGYTFDNGVRPFGILGLSSLSIDESTDFVLESSSGGAVRFGFGVEYAPTAFNNVALRVGYEGDIFFVDGSDDFILDDEYAMDVGTLYISANLHF